MTISDRDGPVQLLDALQLIGISVDGRAELEAKLAAAGDWRDELVHRVLTCRKTGIAFSMEHEAVAQDAFAILMTRRFSMAQTQQILNNVPVRS